MELYINETRQQVDKRSNNEAKLKKINQIFTIVLKTISFMLNMMFMINYQLDKLNKKVITKSIESAFG